MSPHAIVIPYSSLLVQAFNVLVLFGVLIYALRNVVGSYFATRAEDYRRLVTQAEAARVAAERGKMDIEQKLARLESESADQSGLAQREAGAMREQMMNEAKALAGKIEREAEWSARMLVEKAWLGVRRELLDRALAGATENLKNGVGSTEQRRLQDEFVDKIQVVSR